VIRKTGDGHCFVLVFMTPNGLKTIDMTKLAHWADEDCSFALIDVLPDDAFNCSSTSSGAALAEADFLDQVYALGVKRDRPVVLYESGLAAIHTEQAAEALLHAGFRQVYRFVGPQSAFHASQHA
jgi:hypothetical protein